MTAGELSASLRRPTEMDQLRMLWDYQQADMAAERFKSEFRSSELRQKLEKDRNFIMDQQKSMKKIEADVAVMADRKEAIMDEFKRLSQLSEQLEARMSEAPAEDIEQTQKYLKEARKLMDLITQYENEMRKLKKDATVRDSQQREVVKRAAKAKSEFDELKKSYDVEYKEATTKLEVMKADIAKKAAGINQEYLSEYQQVKKHVVPPMAKLNGDRCGGCNMNLPQAVLKEIKASGKIVECETCGRMIVSID